MTPGLMDIRITEGALPVAKLLELAPDPGHGAVVSFFGVVRNRNHGRDVTAVEYDCYEPMAVAELRRIADEARERFGPSLGLVAHHARGRLVVGDASVGIVVTSPHRPQAFAACRYVIDELKKRVPIWKKEHYVDGATEWLPGQHLCEHAASAEPEAR